MANLPSGRRGGRRSRNLLRSQLKPKAERAVQPGMIGGRYRVLGQRDMESIHNTALRLLEEVGFAQAIPSMVTLVTDAGGTLDDQGRLHFPRTLVEQVIASARRSYVMPGWDDEHSITVGGQRVHTGTGGAAPMMVDFHSGDYRSSTLLDVYDIARLVDTLDNIHYYWRSVVASDMPSAFDLDVNTVYACISGTTKPIGASLVDSASVRAVVSLIDIALGGEGVGDAFRERPICSISCCHVVPPLRFAEESCDALEAAIRAGMPATLLSAPQAGATSPAALAGTIAQTTAEALAGLVFCYLIDPMCKVNLGMWPFVSDLRTGAMSGGSAEQALLSAGCAQMFAFYDLPGSTAAGMADAKIPDAQSGSEKAYTVALTANAGATLIMETAGMHASLLGASLESFVIDNDMLGSVQRTVRGIEVNSDTLSFDVIREVVHGPGHFLGHDQTLERMESDYFYPLLGDRDNPEVWTEKGKLDIVDRARAHTQQVLGRHYPSHISPERDKKIREAFQIFLNAHDMRAGNGRW